MGAPSGARTVIEVVHARPRPAASFDGLLGDDERTRMAALRRPDDRDRFATAHALLRVVAASWAGTTPDQLVLGATCRHCGGPHGRPEVRVPSGIDLHLSLSRSGPDVLVAVTRLGPVGVDSEAPVAEDFDGFDGVALTTTETAAVAALEPERRSHGRAILWARKEAVLKATGHGLMVEPTTVELSPPFTAAALVAWHGPDGPAPEAVQLVDLALPSGACGAVAVLSAEGPEVRVRSGEELLGAS